MSSAIVSELRLLTNHHRFEPGLNVQRDHREDTGPLQLGLKSYDSFLKSLHIETQFWYYCKKWGLF